MIYFCGLFIITTCALCYHEYLNFMDYSHSQKPQIYISYLKMAMHVYTVAILCG